MADVQPGEVAPIATPLIQLVGATKRFGARTVLENVDLRVRAGETVVILGPSGGGKSTLLRLVNGLTPLDSGQVVVGPHVIGAGVSPTGVDVRQVRRLVGMVFQDFQLFPHLTALDNVAIGPQRVLGQSLTAAQATALTLLERVGLAGHAAHFPSQLSGGQKQRVAIARALALRPQALLCDEITSALDPELKQEVLAVLEELKREGLTILMVTHEIGFARRAADRVIVLADGRVIEDGPPADVLERPRSERTRRFLRDVLN